MCLCFACNHSNSYGDNLLNSDAPNISMCAAYLLAMCLSIVASRAPLQNFDHEESFVSGWSGWPVFAGTPVEQMVKTERMERTERSTTSTARTGRMARSIRLLLEKDLSFQ
jgi:hypothetical protein